MMKFLQYYTNFTLCVLLESIYLMLLTLTRRAYKATGGLETTQAKQHDKVDRLSSMRGYRKAK